MGVANAIPLDDNDEAFKWSDVQGETLYTNPPLDHNPTVDHGCEEDDIWSFRKTLFGQIVVKN